MATGNPFDDLIPRPGATRTVSNDVSAPQGTMIDPAATLVDVPPQPDPFAAKPGTVRQPMPGTYLFGEDYPRTAGQAPIGATPPDKPPVTPGGIEDAQQWAEVGKGVIPGMIQSAGTTLQAPDVALARAQQSANAFGGQQLQIMDRIDRGEPVPETEDAIGYQHMNAGQKAAARAELMQAQAAFAPTPVQDRTLFKTGEALQDYGRKLIPAAPGYEESFGRQVGEGLGSVAFGLPVSMVAGPFSGAAIYGAMGVGEATQRAVEFDKKERAAGRPGLSQDQITAAGLLGVGPGATDALPVEVLLGRLPVKIPPALARPLAQGIAKIGIQATIEGVQEGGQSFLQDLIAREVYDSGQKLGATLWNEASVGAGVGGLVETLQQLGSGLVRSAAGRRGAGPHATHPTQQTQEPAQAAPERQDPQLPWPTYPGTETPPQGTPAASDAIPPPAATSPSNVFADLIPEAGESRQIEASPDTSAPVATGTGKQTGTVAQPEPVQPVEQQAQIADQEPANKPAPQAVVTPDGSMEIQTTPGLFADETTQNDVLKAAERKSDEDDASTASGMGQGVRQGRRANERRPNEASGQGSGKEDQILAAIQSDYSTIEGEARDLLRDARQFEKSLLDRKATPEQIAAAFTQRYGAPVDPNDVTSGNVWWGRLPGERNTNDYVDPKDLAGWLPDEIADARNAVQPGEAIATDVNARPSEPQSLRGIEGGESRLPTLTADQREAALSLFTQGLNVNQIAKELSAQSGKYVRPRLVQDSIKSAQSEISAAQRKSATDDRMRATRSQTMRDVMARPEMQDWLRERGRQLATSKGQTVWTPEMIERLGSPEMRTATANDVAARLKAEFGTAAASLTPNAVRQKRSDLGYGYKGDKFFGASPFTDAMRKRLTDPDIRALQAAPALAKLKSEFGDEATARLTPTSITNARAGNPDLAYVGKTGTPKGFQWTHREDGRNPDARLVELMRDRVSPADRARILNDEFGGSLTPKAVQRRWDKIKAAALKARGDEPMFAVGGWDARSWLDWIKGTKHGTDGQPASAAKDSRTTPAESGVIPGQQSRADEARQPVDDRDEAGGRSGWNFPFPVGTDFMARLIEGSPTVAGLRQGDIVVRKKETWHRNDPSSWIAKGRIKEVEPGTWTIDSFQVRKNKQRQGIGNQVLDAIEQQLGEPLVAPQIMSAQGYSFWRRRELEGSRFRTTSVDDYVRYRNEYYTPQRLRDLLDLTRAAAEVAPKGSIEANLARKEARDLEDVVSKLPPEDDILAAIGGLDMSQEARKKRAEAEGFDTSRVWYHGTTKDFDSFDPRKANKANGMPKATFLASDPETANYFARGSQDGARVIPVYAKRGKFFDFRDPDSAAELSTFLKGKKSSDIVPGYLGSPNTDGFIRSMENGDWGILERPAVQQWLKRKGFDGWYARERADSPVTLAITDPSLVRSVNAAFDPSKSSSADLMAAVDSDLGARRDSALRGRAMQSLANGKVVKIAPDVLSEGLDQIKPLAAMFPPEVPIGAVESIAPYKNFSTAGMVRVTFRLTDGSKAYSNQRWSSIAGVRNGLWPSVTEDGRNIGVVGFFRFDFTGYTGQVFRGELGHENVHALRRSGRLSDFLVSRLARHSDDLRVMNMGLGTFLSKTGHPNAGVVDNESLSKIYKRLYSGLADYDERIAQEKIAHLTELYNAGAVNVDPEIAGVLDSILDGSIWRGSQGETQGEVGLDEPVAATGGRPSMRAYHGTDRDFDNNKFTVGKRTEGMSGSREGPLGVWMTNDAEVASNFADWASRGGHTPPRVIPLDVDFQNPLIVNNYSEIKDIVDRHTKFTHPNYVVSGRQIRMGTDKVDYEAARQALLDMGYDGIVLKDTLTDSPDGKTRIDQYVAIKPGTVRNAMTGDVMYASQKGKTRMSALHNLSAENLAFADRMGGIAVPSLAVVKEGMGIEDGAFGDITLIGNKDLADPTKTPIFDADAWTTRFPKPEYKAAPTKKAQAFVDKLRPYVMEYRDTGVEQAWDHMVNRPDPERAVSALLRDRGMMAMFLRENKGQNVPPVMIPALDRGDFPWVDTAAFRNFLATNPVDWSYSEPADPDTRDKNLARAISDAIDEFVSSGKMQKPSGPKWDAKDAEYFRDLFRDEVLDQDGNMNVDPYRVWDRGAKLLDQTTVDPGATREALESAIEPYKPEFKTWVEDQIVPLYGEPRLKLRGKLVPYTLDNIVDVMTKGPVAAQEEHMTFGEGKARAAAAKQFKDLESMRDYSEWQMAPASEVNAAREKAKELLDAWREKIVNFSTTTDWRGNIDTWNALDNSMRAMARWAKGKHDTAGLRSALSREGFKSVPQDVLDLGVEAGKAFLEAPVPYFEAKPQRAVKLNEFAGAVIPSNASQETKDLLTKHGIPFTTYNKKSPTAQAEAAAKYARKLAKEGKDTLFAVQRGRIRDQDSLGYYSQALESARELKQAKGTPEQMLAQLKKSGVKDAEIEATKLRDFMAGKTSVTRDQIIDHLEGHRVGLKEKRYDTEYGQMIEERKLAAQYRERGMSPDQAAIMASRVMDKRTGRGGDPKWSSYSLDPSNPTYRETVLHLPGGPPVQGRDRSALYRTAPPNGDFRSGHFPEPNIIGHMMTSMTTHEGKPVYTIDQIQSDWGQKLRDGGVRDEAKIAELRRRHSEAKFAADTAYAEADKWVSSEMDMEPVGRYADEDSRMLIRERLMSAEGGTERYHKVKAAEEPQKLLWAEIRTAEASTPGHPLVNTTDQWVNTTLRRAIRQAAEADADYIAIPSGKTVLSYNPGDEHGMEGFYDRIVPKNLKNILSKIDKNSPDPQRIETLDSPSGKTGLGKGFTLFPLTDTVKQSVLDDGQPLFAFGGLTSPEADITKWTQAVLMSKKGASPDEIWNATGWAKDKKGEWVTETQHLPPSPTVAEARLHHERAQLTPQERKSTPPRAIMRASGGRVELPKTDTSMLDAAIALIRKRLN